jgi:ACS family hexuronate transporter-like MFS transporter
LGIGEAGNWPGGVKVVAEWFPEQERALASGIFNSGSAVGAILAPPVVAYILLSFGWPAAFIAVGILGFVWLGFWWPTYRTPSALTELPQVTIPLRQLLRSRFVISLTVSKVFLDPVWYFYTFWFPEYLKNGRHFDMASIGKYSWIPFLVAGLGNYAGGWIAGLLLHAGWGVSSARKTGVTFFAVLMMSAIPAVLVNEAWLSIAFVSIAMLGYTGALANMLAMPADVYPKSAVASIWGLASMGSGFGGMLFSLMTGWAVDRYSYTPVFIGFGLLPLICATILWTTLDSKKSASIQTESALR